MGQAMEIIAGHTLRLVGIAPVRDSRHHDLESESVFGVLVWISCGSLMLCSVGCVLSLGFDATCGLTCRGNLCRLS